jgi:hypothetical protein
MSNIVIKELNLPGFYLLSSEESYLNEINDNELDLTRGGLLPLLIAFGAGGTASVIARKIHDYNRGPIALL